MRTSSSTTSAGAKILAVWLVLASLAWAGTAAVSLGTAQSFAVLGASTVTNTGASVITGDVGVSPGTAITGFPAGSTFHAGDAVALQAQADVTTAYNDLAGRACGSILSGQDLGGQTLTAGVYCFSSSAQQTGNLTLDAEGATNAEFIFQISSTMVTSANSVVLLVNGTNPCKVFWQVGDSATIGIATAFQGNIIAQNSITLSGGAALSGRAIARTGAVTMDTIVVSTASCVSGGTTSAGTTTGTGSTSSQTTSKTSTGTDTGNSGVKITATLAPLLISLIVGTMLIL